MSHLSQGGRVGVVLSVDAGTTGVTVLLVTAEAEVLARGYAEFAQHFPHPGWVEHAPEEIWQATQTAARIALTRLPRPVVQPGASPTRAGPPAYGTDTRWRRRDGRSCGRTGVPRTSASAWSLQVMARASPS